jgi:hypothetical protein
MGVPVRHGDNDAFFLRTFAMTLKVQRAESMSRYNPPILEAAGIPNPAEVNSVIQKNQDAC